MQISLDLGSVGRGIAVPDGGASMNPDFKSMSYLGLAAVFTAWAFILASIALNPWWVGHFTTGALSELGTPGDHVKYPWIYNSGLVITSILAFLYSVSLAYLSLNRVQVVGSAFFMIASVFLAMIGIFHGVWASLNFHEFVSNPQPLGFTGVTGKPVHTPPPL